MQLESLRTYSKQNLPNGFTMEINKHVAAWQKQSRLISCSLKNKAAKQKGAGTRSITLIQRKDPPQQTRQIRINTSLGAQSTGFFGARFSKAACRLILSIHAIPRCTCGRQLSADKAARSQLGPAPRVPETPSRWIGSEYRFQKSRTVQRDFTKRRKEQI